MINLASIDLNLLHVLHVVLEEGSATRAARRLHVTQSAVSNALARLRTRIGDPLVVRVGGALVPTPVAAAMMPELARAVEHFRSALQRVAPFDPRTDPRRFRLKLADYQALTDLPSIFHRLRQEAPLTTIEVVGTGADAGELDARLAPVWAVHDAYHAPLYIDGAVLLARQDLPELLTLESLAARPHVDVQVGRSGNQEVERAFRAAGVERNVVLTVPHFLAAVLAVAQSDAICVVPTRLANLAVQAWPVRLQALPFDAPAVPIHLGWSASTDEDPGSQWFRALVKRALGSGPAQDSPPRGAPIHAAQLPPHPSPPPGGSRVGSSRRARRAGSSPIADAAPAPRAPRRP
jgi:DNA-binding transcriptional LysR family regulator